MIKEYGRGTPHIENQFLILNLQRHAPNSKILDDPVTFKFIESFGEFNYELQSMILHHGESWDKGHFITISRKNGEWLLFNDDIVTTLDERIVCDAITVHGFFKIIPESNSKLSQKLNNDLNEEFEFMTNQLTFFDMKFDISILLFRQINEIQITEDIDNYQNKEKSKRY